MKAVVVFALLLCSAFAVDLYEEFIDWSIKHGKTYTSGQEHVSRYNAFKSNYALVRHLNRQDKGHFELNEFADLTQEEFAAKYLGLVPIVAAPHLDVMSYNRFKDYPDKKNWVDEGAVTPVKNQGNCGSCWAFSATGNMEGVYFVAHKQLPDISEQQLVDCEHECMIFPGTSDETCDDGCDGGLMPNAFTYAIKTGLVASEDYPYKGVAQTCKVDTSKIKYHFTKWNFIEAKEEAMVAALNTNGPLAIAVDASFWSFYHSGIYDSICSSSSMNHGVLLVGYGEEGTKKYWIVKNSWGDRWGEKGYMRLIRGKNKCGVDNFVCTIVA